eukprot:6499253-Alexandrium_andersonii.AAC.1
MASSLGSFRIRKRRLVAFLRRGLSKHALVSAVCVGGFCKLGWTSDEGKLLEVYGLREHT